MSAGELTRVVVKPDDGAGLPDCPVEGCGFQSYNPHRMHDHLGPDGHDLWQRILSAEVQIHD